MLVGCGEVPDPPWVLGDDPLVLGLRTEVIEEGPHSRGFLPIPEDRIRAEPMPLDTFHIRALVADSSGELDTSSLAPHWFLCPYDDGACISTLNDPGAGKPCRGWPEARVACSLGASTDLEVTLPALDPTRTLIDHASLQIAFVASDPALTTTERCIETLGAEELGSLRGCMLAYAFVQVGPLFTLAALAQAEGVPLGIEEEVEIPPDGATLTPNYNPEIEQMIWFGDGKEYVSKPGEVTVLPADTLFGWTSPFDLADAQGYLSVDADGSVFSLVESSDTAIFFTEPDLRTTFREQIWTGDGIESFSAFVVVTDRRGGQAFERFDIVIGDP